VIVGHPGQQRPRALHYARFTPFCLAVFPVAFGSHRKPEAVLIPCEAYERYEALARQRGRLDGALSAAQPVQVKLPGAFGRRCPRSGMPTRRRVLRNKLGLSTSAELVVADGEISHAALLQPKATDMG
jgi:hypothetical protein